jgi:hypothetical protein
MEQFIVLSAAGSPCGKKRGNETGIPGKQPQIPATSQSL